MQPAAVACVVDDVADVMSDTRAGAQVLQSSISGVGRAGTPKLE
jgi:hypothetical protein